MPIYIHGTSVGHCTTFVHAAARAVQVEMCAIPLAEDIAQLSRGSQSISGVHLITARCGGIVWVEPIMMPDSNGVNQERKRKEPKTPNDRARNSIKELNE